MPLQLPPSSTSVHPTPHAQAIVQQSSTPNATSSQAVYGPPQCPASSPINAPPISSVVDPNDPLLATVAPPCVPAVAAAPTLQHPMITRSKDGTRTPKAWLSTRYPCWLNALGEAEQISVGDDKELELEIVKKLRDRCFEQESPKLFPANAIAIYRNSSIIHAHLLRLSGHGIRVCPKVNFETLSEMQKVVEDAENRLKRGMPKKVPLPPSSYQSMGMGSSSTGAIRQEGFEPRKRKASGNTALEKAFNSNAREQLHSEIARMFYSSGLPFHLARNPHYASSYSFAANNLIVGYVPPGYNLLRTSLLQKERANVERLLETTKKSWKEKGLSIVTDGWTDSQRRPLINFMAASESGAMFWKAINCEGEVKDKFFISNLINQVIEEVGPKNVVQVITDNAPVCSSAGLLIQGKYSNIFWTPCVVHTLNLALKNICAAKNIEKNAITYEKCHWITDIVGDVMFIKNFIMNHSMRLAIFNEFVPLKLLAVADTRFASSIIMLKRFKLIKRGLQKMVISDKWVLYKEDNIGKAIFVKENVLNDIFWDKIDYILSFTLPIYEMLRFCDTDKPCLHLVYEMWDAMIEKVKASIYRHEGKLEHEESTFYSVVHEILVERWAKSNTPLHCLAHSLNPRYYSSMWLDENPNRVPPHKDDEISNMRNKCFKKYFPCVDERRAVNVEYAKFSGCLDTFEDHDSKNDRGAMEPLLWWFAHGTYASIFSIERADNTWKERPSYGTLVEMDLIQWRVLGLLAIASLSLDEPDMEAIIFADEGEDDINEVP
ncbi:hypothetical protein HHK36_025980 [Tetracentron sinense]|uniref:DUF659 domain-containing protein n=1 Tax=Tetracentron sinense TaxID=13715 RepID=A0A834YNL4_TETSI|nr:hypothetical protein HHK36_025980 [Tetracentron sinense]